MPQFQLFDTPIDLGHSLWRQQVRPGDLVVDATAGNGYDTAFLAEAVGPTGRVVACDIQEVALAATRSRLSETLKARVDLHRICHAALDTLLRDATVALAVYNLGYLPGGDKGLTTTVETTLASLNGMQPKIRPGGLISVTCYPGHPEGADEENALVNWAQGLDKALWIVTYCRWLNRDRAPSLILIQRALGNNSPQGTGSIALGIPSAS